MKLYTTALAILLAGLLQAQVPTPIVLEEFATGFDKPTAITNAGDDRLFVAEKDGLVRILNADGSIEATPFLDVQSLTNTSGFSDERGLLGLAFHPDYADNGYLYVNYTRTNGDTRITRFTVSGDPNVMDESTAQTIITIDQPFGNHNGGDLKFGPDGYLYIGMGDGGSAGDPDNYAQNMSSLLGKMLRIDVDVPNGYQVPTDNPFVNSGSDTLPEIWASGLRNPWRFSFDSATGDLYMGDVGQGNIEEVDYQPASSTGGENYGWRCFEGNSSYNSSGCLGLGAYDGPVVTYTHGFDHCSITGGYVYRGSAYPEMVGKYFYTDYCSGRFWTAELNDADEWVVFEVSEFQGFGWSTFGEDADGELYAANQSQGTIYQIQDACGSFDAGFTFDTETSLLTATEGVSYQWFLNGVSISGATSQQLDFLGNGMYSVFIEDENGCSAFSEMQEITLSSVQELDNYYGIRLQQNPVRDELTMIVGNPNLVAVQLQVMDLSGRIVMEERVMNAETELRMNVSTLVPGAYLLQMLGEEGRSVVRFVKD
jgi:glucose/arabinose dehydrogenase